MKNYNWTKGYKYVNVPVHVFRFDLIGWIFILQSKKTRKRRVGAITTKDKIWNLYGSLLTPLRKEEL